METPSLPSPEEVQRQMGQAVQTHRRRLQQITKGRRRKWAHPGSKVPTDIRNEAKRVRSKAAKQSRRANR